MKYISVEEAGKKFNLSARSIRNYCTQGRIPGAILKGKTWLIPENASKPERISANSGSDDEAISLGQELIDFIDNSPCAFLAIKNVRKILIENGYNEVFENKKYTFYPGDKVFLTRNDSSLIALNIGREITEETGFSIIASHDDSPCFKIKPQCDGKVDIYNKVNVAPYGGLIAPTWLDRPLAVAGRVIINNNDNLEKRIVNFEDLNLMIPNLCVHRQDPYHEDKNMH